MSGYISEIQYYGDSDLEFIEIALPAGTDPSGYTINIYDGAGNLVSSFQLGVSTAKVAGQVVYVVDASTPGFSTSDSTGNLHPDDSIALVDGAGNVVQFISYWGNTVTAVDGPAAGLTSIDVGTANIGQSLQSDDGGNTYYVQDTPNSGSIPACYAPGTLISTPDGPKPVENLQAGDRVCGVNTEIQTIRWVWTGSQPLDDVELHQKPVLIQKDALGTDLPNKDLIVSGQHRIVVGMNGQLEAKFREPLMVPAKALVVLPGVRFMAGKRSISWYHFVCDEHSVVFANGAASETLLLASEIVRNLSGGQRAELSRVLRRPVTPETQQACALAFLTVGQTKRLLKRGRTPEPDIHRVSHAA